MKQKLLYVIAIAISFLSFTVFANTFFPLPINATNTNSCSAAVLHSATKTAFCSTTVSTGFPAVVACNCEAQGMPASFCTNIPAVYAAMQVRFLKWGSQWLAHACAGHGTSVQECEDQWNCFMYGTNGNANQKISDGECFGLTSTTGC